MSLQTPITTKIKVGFVNKRGLFYKGTLDFILACLFCRNINQYVKLYTFLVMPVSLVATKFDVYKDEDSPVIYDIDEERALRRTKQQTSERRDSNMTRSRYRSINLTRK